jgi:hypothetical protein
MTQCLWHYLPTFRQSLLFLSSKSPRKNNRIMKLDTSVYHKKDIQLSVRKKIVLKMFKEDNFYLFVI